MKLAAGLVFVLALLSAGCTTQKVHVAPTLAGDAAHPAATVDWVRTELYFALGPAKGHGGVDEDDWRVFLDREVTPRFPSGLTVVDAYGQWQGRDQREPERLRSKVVVLLYADSPAQRESVDAIRAAWKAKTGDQSVLRVSQPADVSF